MNIEQKSVNAIRVLAADTVQKLIQVILVCHLVVQQWHMNYGLII
mgnify:FL=1